MFPSPAIQPTPPASSTPLQALTKNSALKTAKSIFPLLPAAARAEHFTPTTWRQVLTDTMGRMHSDAQFAGSSSVPAHVEMMGLIGMGNNPMVGATVAVAVAVEEAAK